MTHSRQICIMLFSLLAAAAHADFQLGNLDRGYTFEWIDVNGDTEPDYCRIVKTNGLNASVSCTLGRLGKAGISQWSPLIDAGYPDSRTYEKLKKGINFCRRVGERDVGSVICTEITSGEGNNLNLGATTVRKTIVSPEPKQVIRCSQAGSGLMSSINTDATACIAQYGKATALGLFIKNSCDRSIFHRIRYSNNRGNSRDIGVLVCPGGEEHLIQYECSVLGACNKENWERTGSEYR